MAAATLLLVLTVVALGSGHVEAFDPNPLQDFCVADPTSKVHENGLACKDPAAVVADDFLFRGLDKPGGTTSKRFGFTAHPVQIPGLNTLGESHVRLDVAPGGVFPCTTTRGRRRRRWCWRAPSTSASSPPTRTTSSTPRCSARATSSPCRRGSCTSSTTTGARRPRSTPPSAARTRGWCSSATRSSPGAPDELLAKTLLTDAHTMETIKANFRRS
ncbi:hypothetical protein ZWY2020_034421 [Hordeum vulgare]|nr:hypothetical protein ZWY2020_034421 [Hordeum vulgare]